MEQSSSDQEDQEVPEKSDLFGEDSDDSDSGPDDVDNVGKPSKVLLESSSSDSESEPGPPLKKRMISDDEQDLDEDPEEPAKDHERSDEDEEKDPQEEGGPQMLDFDIMMQKKREENRKLHNKRRKTKDIDMINDNDDAIAKLMADMRMAAHEDREHNQKGEPATKKLAMLNTVKLSISKIDLRLAFVEANVLSVITDWLAPLPRDKSLPHVNIRETLLKFLFDVPIDDYSRLKESGVGKAVMYLYRHPKHPRYLKDLCGRIINKWSRPIFNLQGDFSSMTKEERISRDKQMSDRISAANRLASKRKAESESKKELKPGDPGWIGRARVPMVDNREYVQRPEWTSHTDMSRVPKKEISLLEKHKRKFADKRKILKAQHAVSLSIEGKAMNGV